MINKSQVEYYNHVRCYRIKNITSEADILALARKLGIQIQYRCDCIDLFVPNGAGLTQLILKWGSHLEYLSWLDYHCNKYHI
jgi:hypothetical protein